MSGGYGYVTSTSPLEITVDQKKILTEAQLILTDAVRDYAVEMTTLPDFHETEEISGGAGDASFAPHKHRYQGKKKWMVHNALQMGEKVILLRCDGGENIMATLPTTGDDLDLVSFAVETQPSYTHKLDIEQNRVRGMTDEQDAVLQAVYLILNVERYAFPIYSRNYGSELSDLIGKPKDYAMSEIKRRITEALLQDDRITSLDGWEFETGRNWVTARFTVHTIYGDVSAEKEVDI